MAEDGYSTFFDDVDLHAPDVKLSLDTCSPLEPPKPKPTKLKRKRTHKSWCIAEPASADAAVEMAAALALETSMVTMDGKTPVLTELAKRAVAMAMDDDKQPPLPDPLEPGISVSERRKREGVQKEREDDREDQRVPIWNSLKQVIIGGFTAPKRRNLVAYFLANPFAKVHVPFRLRRSKRARQKPSSDVLAAPLPPPPSPPSLPLSPPPPVPLTLHPDVHLYALQTSLLFKLSQTLAVSHLLPRQPIPLYQTARGLHFFP